ncbi:MAG: SUMF1/EgtB/PvdO family nonheme iron enzyme [Treponema sp.]|nr:SUMF1/EgtB/PvdO family nonheme iron enzyme [Treponema sp.]
MTRAELEEDVSIGDTVKITTKSGKFTGRVEEFGESAVMLTNPENGKSKRIAYAFIIEYDTGKSSFKDILTIGIDTDSKLVKIPKTNYWMGQTPVTQRLYEKVMNENPSYHQLSNDKLKDDERKALEELGTTDNNPVENVSWYDAVYFCNKLSIMEGLTPAYSVDGETDPVYWGYTPHQEESIGSNVDCDFYANGYRLPTNDEWEEAAKGGEIYKYSGSYDLDEVGWYEDNSSNVTHPVAQKMANAYGLYDMSGNVWDWVWETSSSSCRFVRGGSFYADCVALYPLVNGCMVSFRIYCSCARNQYISVGFRLLRPQD